MAVILGVGQTAFRRAGDATHADLAREAIAAALADAGVEPGAIGAVWLGSAAAHAWGEASAPGARWLQGPGSPWASGAPIVQVEAACATGGAALHAAWCAVEAGAVDLALVVGVDRGGVADPVALLDGAFDAARSLEFAAAEAERAGIAFAPGQGRPALVELTALEATYALSRGLNREALAAVAAKNRTAGAQNPLAWLRKPTDASAVLAEPQLAPPFSRSMVCALVDGAAAVVLARDGLGAARAVPIAAIGLGGGTWRGLGERPALSALAARAFARVGWSPSDLQVAEVHDANAYAELKLVDALGLGAHLPVNPSGGLLARGHALAATGLAQVGELVQQLRGEAGERQVAGARRALAHNGGGLIGFDDAVSVVTLLGR